MILVALLGLASCEVERPPTVEANLTTVPADPPVVPVESPTTQTDPAANSVEAIEAEMQARRAERAADPWGFLTPARAAPVSAPMTDRPEIRNRIEVQAALMREYPAALRDAGIGGTVVVWFFISDGGVVEDSRISETSGQAQLDEAALRVAKVMQFTPAMNRAEPVAVWIQVPITFQA